MNKYKDIIPLVLSSTMKTAFTSFVFFYQTLHFFGGFIGEPMGQLKVVANSWELIREPFTLKHK
jgi:hypothetical protein